MGIPRGRDFRLFLASQTISALGDGAAVVALAFAALNVGGVSALAWIMAGRQISFAVALLPAGAWCDRFPRQQIILWAALTRFLAQGACASLVLADSASVVNLTILQVMYGVALAFSRPGVAGFLPQLVGTSDLQAANGYLAISRNSILVLGPAVGGALVGTAGPGFGLALDAGSFLVSAVLVALMRVPRGVRAMEERLFTSIRSGWSEFASRTWVWAMVLSFGLLQLVAFPALFVLGPLLAQRELGGAGAWGVVLACGSAGSIVGSVVSTRIRPRRPLVAVSLLSAPYALPFLALSVHASLLVVATALLSANLGISLANTIWLSRLQERIPSEALSRISSYDWLGSTVLTPIGYVIIGPLTSLLGPETLLSVVAGATAGIALSPLLVRGVRSERR